MNEILNQISSKIEPEIPRHITKWGGVRVLDTDESWTPGATFDSYQQWTNNVGGFSRFINERPFYARFHIENYFGLEGLSKFSVQQNNEEAGLVKLYHKPLSSSGYEGDHFKGIPIELTAFAHNGYTFSHWVVNEAGREKEYKSQTIEITPDKETNIVAHFEAVPNQVSKVIINEINYNSLPETDPGDWLEIYNTGNQTIDLTNWELKDENDENIFNFPQGFELRAKQFLVICENTNEFHEIFPQVKSRIGNLGFKLSNDGEVIRLFDHQKELVDSVRYGDMSPWVESPDGLGPTLELISPHLDNNLPESWEASTEFGSPGKTNNINDNPFSLFPAYPNPASYSTTIPYSINQSSEISIRIMDNLGRQITSLVNENQEPGDYFLEYEISHLARGMYFYSLMVDGELIATRKMIVN